MAVAVGDQRRKREAMDHLVSEISRGEEDNIANSLRIAIEVQYNCPLSHTTSMVYLFINHLFLCYLQRGWLTSFTDSLTEAKRKKEAEIDRICSRHYGDFLSSVSEMLKLRGDAGHLASLVTDVHEKFSTTGGDLVAVINELNIIQSERENARKLLEYTIQCKKISSLMVNTKEQIESDDHYLSLIHI